MITRELEENINFTRTDARRRRLELVTVEHLVLVLIDNTSVRDCLSDCNADIPRLRQDLEHFIESQVPHAESEINPTLSDEFHRVIKRAVHQTGALHRRRTSGAHVIAAVFAEPNSRAAYYLRKHGVERLAVLAHANRNRQSKNGEETSVDDFADLQRNDNALSTTTSQSKNKPVTAESNWTALAAEGKLESPFGRDEEVADIARILGRKYKNNPLLVGAPGVGKTAIVQKLAHTANNTTAPPSLHGLSIFSVSIGDLVAGTKYRGDFEQRLRQLLDKCRANKNSVLFIDEIHTLIGAGAVSGGNLDAANLLKPVLDGSLRCIGATTVSEYRRIFEKDAALSRRFQKVDIDEPNDSELRAILNGVIGRLSQHHGVVYENDAAAAAIKYSRRYLPTRFLPDKAIDILDDAGARRNMANTSPADKASQNGMRNAKGRKVKPASKKSSRANAVKQSKSVANVNDENDSLTETITARDIATVAAQLSGVPPHLSNNTLADLQQQLSERVLAQPAAAECLAAAVRRMRLGYHDNARVGGAFLFAGPTGVGKTEMARQLAALLGAPLLRFDMSEYREAHSLSRLIGAPPGYVGFERSGQLVEEIARCPNSVVLLDEIEKAHPEIHSVFLQIMDYGVLTDNTGRAADFSRAILIMTSNAGANEWSQPPPGFAREDAADAGVESIRRLFAPEFRNRLDAVVRFMPLSATAITRIAKMRLRQLANRLREEKNITIKFGRRFCADLRQDGFSTENGARPLERLLRERVLDILAKAESEGTLTDGGQYEIETANDGSGEIIVQPIKEEIAEDAMATVD